MITALLCCLEQELDKLESCKSDKTNVRPELCCAVLPLDFISLFPVFNLVVYSNVKARETESEKTDVLTLRLHSQL